MNVEKLKTAYCNYVINGMLSEYEGFSEQLLVDQKIVYSSSREFSDQGIKAFIEQVKNESNLNKKSLEVILADPKLFKKVRVVKGYKIEQLIYRQECRRWSFDIDLIVKDEAAFSDVCDLLIECGYEEALAIDLQLKNPCETFSTRFVPKGSGSDRGFEIHCHRFPIDLHGRSLRWEEMEQLESHVGERALQVLFLLTQFDRKNRCLARDAVELELLLKDYYPIDVGALNAIANDKNIQLPKIAQQLVPIVVEYFPNISHKKRRTAIPVIEHLRLIVDKVDNDTLIGRTAIKVLDNKIIVRVLRRLNFPLVVVSSTFCKNKHYETLKFAKRTYYYSTTGSDFEPV